MSEHDVIFDAMGSHVRLLIGEPGPGMAPAAGRRRAGEAVHRRVRRDALAIQTRQRALRAERGPARTGSRLRAAAGRGQGRARCGRAERRARRPDSGRRDRVGRLRRLARRGARRAAGRGARRGARRDSPPAQPGGQCWRRIEVDDDAGTILRPPGRPLRHRRHRQGPRGRPGRRAASAATRASSSTAAATSGSAAPELSSTPSRSSSSTP